jgi:hypothetical protein
MADVSLEEQEQSNSTEIECELDEIDIVSDPIAHEISEGTCEPSPDSHRNDTRTDGKCKQVITSATGDKKEGRLSNAVVDSGLFEDHEKLVDDETEFPTNKYSLQKVQFTSVDEGVPDEDDVYKRFYFESDHLALKDNAE